MKAMLYLAGKDEPAAVLDEVTLVQFNDNHKISPVRVSFKSSKFNAGKTGTVFGGEVGLKLSDLLAKE